MKSVALAMTDRDECRRRGRDHQRVHARLFDRGDAADGRRRRGARRHRAARDAIYLSAVPAQTAARCDRARGALAASGFEPVPHLAVRGFANRPSSTISWRGWPARPGCGTCWSIAGDRDPPAGSLRSAIDVIDGGMLQRHGIREVGIAGYPEGHPRIPGHELDRALADKIAAAEATGLGVHIVTQFCFDADAIIGWVRRLRDFGIRHAGADRPGRADQPADADALCQPVRRRGLAAGVGAACRADAAMCSRCRRPTPSCGRWRRSARNVSATCGAAFLLVRRAVTDRALGDGGGTGPDRAGGRAGIQGRTGALNRLAWCPSREVPPCCS